MNQLLHNVINQWLGMKFILLCFSLCFTFNVWEQNSTLVYGRVYVYICICICTYVYVCAHMCVCVWHSRVYVVHPIHVYTFRCLVMCNSLATLWTVARPAPLSMAFFTKNTGVGCHALLQVIVPTERSNLQLLQW